MIMKSNGNMTDPWAVSFCRYWISKSCEPTLTWMVHPLKKSWIHQGIFLVPYVSISEEGHIMPNLIKGLFEVKKCYFLNVLCLLLLSWSLIMVGYRSVSPESWLSTFEKVISFSKQPSEGHMCVNPVLAQNLFYWRCSDAVTCMVACFCLK